MPAVSPVFIANLALNNVGSKSRIENFDEQNTEARTCKLWYDFSRREALEAFDWSFARKRAALALNNATPPADWSYAYAYPADCLKMRRIQNPLEGPSAIPLAITTMQGEWLNPIPFEIELLPDGSAKQILCSLQNAIGVYTFDQQDTGLYTASFVKMFAHQLASNIAVKLTGELEIADKQAQYAAAYSIRASGIDANERQSDKAKDADWIRDR